MADALRPTEEEALAAWAARVRANREQAERVREAPERPDFYAPVAAAFKADPRRTDEPLLEGIPLRVGYIKVDFDRIVCSNRVKR